METAETHEVVTFSILGELISVAVKVGLLGIDKLFITVFAAKKLFMLCVLVKMTSDVDGVVVLGAAVALFAMAAKAIAG